MIVRIGIKSTNKKFYREYHIRGSETLYDLHRFIQSDLGFDDSQMAAFINSEKGLKYTLFNTGSGAMDDVEISTVLKNSSLKYVFDFYNKRHLSIELLGEAEKLPKKTYPLVAESQQDAPGQFEETSIEDFFEIEEIDDTLESLEEGQANIVEE